mgnify:CR=1 FL=1
MNSIIINKNTAASDDDDDEMTICYHHHCSSSSSSSLTTSMIKYHQQQQQQCLYNQSWRKCVKSRKSISTIMTSNDNNDNRGNEWLTMVVNKCWPSTATINRCQSVKRQKMNLLFSTIMSLFQLKSSFLIMSTMLMMMMMMVMANDNISQPLSNSSSIQSILPTEYFYAQDKLSDFQVEKFYSKKFNFQNNKTIKNENSSLHRQPSSTLSSSSKTMTINNRQLQPQQHSLSLLTPNDDNITALKYQLPNIMINQKQNDDNHRLPEDSHQNDDYSQWLRPVYIPPKRSSSSSSSLMETNQTASSILLFGSDMIQSSSSSSSTISTSNTSIHNNNDKNYNYLFNKTSNLQLQKQRQQFKFELKDEQWVAPIIALSTLNMLVILAFECFVIYRACR